jgi:hypothetical protein
MTLSCFLVTHVGFRLLNKEDIASNETQITFSCRTNSFCKLLGHAAGGHDSCALPGNICCPVRAAPAATTDVHGVGN